MNRDEPDVIMTKIREEKNGRGNKSGIYGDFPRRPGGVAGIRWGAGRAPGKNGHPAGTG
jgi:hypothetical protein